MSDETKKETAVPSHQRQKKSTLQKIEGLFSDLEMEQIPEPQPLESGSPEISSPEAALSGNDLPGDIFPESALSDRPLPESDLPGSKLPGITLAPDSPVLSEQTLERETIAEEERIEAPEPSTPVSIPPATPAPPMKTLGVGTASLPTDEEEEAEQVMPAAGTITPIAWENLQVGRPVAEDTQKDQPVKSAYARPLDGEVQPEAAGADQLPGQDHQLPQVSDFTKIGEGSIPQALLLGILDKDPDRIWSEDELALVEQVTGQLTLALENARLFQESRTSAEQLAILNEMSRNLSTQLNVEEVLETIYRYTSRLIDATNFFVAFYLPQTNEIAFPLAIEEGKHVHWPTRTLGEGLAEQVIHNREPLLIDASLHEEGRRSPSPDSREKLEEGATVMRQPLSWLGVPMVYSDQVIGVITVQSYSKAKLYNADHRDLLVAIASQAAVAIQNARLFEQTQSALKALEVGERYQKGVAQAVSVLTERGITALSDVLQILGKAARSSRVLYVETQVDQRGVYWRLISEWLSENVATQFNNPALRRFSTDWLPTWFDELRRNGFITVQAQSASLEGKEFLDSLGDRSFVFLSVPGRHEVPGFIGFEQVDYDRMWGVEEISALRTAASALSNTLAREDLFTQVQLNLSETEAMYQGSAHLNSATDNASILNVLRQHTILGHSNVSDVSINLFDKLWNDWPNVADRPGWLTSIAYWSAQTTSSSEQSKARVDVLKKLSLSTWKAGERLLHPDRPIVVMDISTDSGFDEGERSLYAEALGARSILSVPLNVTGRWIGQIITIFRQITGFPEQDIRRLTSLTGQAAIAIESIRLLEETRQRNEELAIINQIISAASRTLELDQVLPEVLNLVLRTIDFKSGLFSIVDANTNRLQLAVHDNLPDDLISRLTEQGMEGTACDLVYQTGRTIHLPDVLDVPQELSSWKRIFEELGSQGFCSYLGVPLTSKGVKLGTICTFSQTPKTISPQRLSLIEAVGRQIGVVVDNARAYELSQRAVVEISEAERLKTQFLANMSHELRTPLNSIIGFSRVILKGIDGPINDLQSQDLTAIYNSGQHLLGLINDVLDLSKIEAGRMELSFEENVNLEEIINSVMSTIIGLVKDKPIELKVDVTPGLPRLSIDPMKIRQVLLNLLSNAAKFTEKGSITVKAEQRTGSDDQPEVLVQVIDTGPGIAIEDQEKLFQPFSQVDGSPTRRTGGSGLGLSICQALIRLHYGQIGVQSQKGKGSSFYFTLPVNRPERLEKSTQENHSRMLDWGTAPLAYNPMYSAYHPEILIEQISEEQPVLEDLPIERTGSVEILAIDQDPQVINLYRRYLIGQECSVTGLTELEKAIEIVRDTQPFAILLDVAMKPFPENLDVGSPDGSSLNGWKVLQVLKSDPSTKRIPVIICSIQVDPQKAIQMGATDYLLKPILEEDLIQAIQDLRKGAIKSGANQL